MPNVMLDLETLDTRPTGAILSIGAVVFSGKGVTDEFYQTIFLQSCIDAGLTVNGSTFRWWMERPDEARSALFTKSLSLEEALTKFEQWLPAGSKVWGNGSDFDNAMLAHAFDKLGMEVPWKFWNNRCYRTTNALLGKNIPVERSGTHHNALDDARTQAEHLIQILNAIKG